MIIKDDIEIFGLMYNGKPVEEVKVNGKTVYLRDATEIEVKFNETATNENLYYVVVVNSGAGDEEVIQMPLGIKEMPESRKLTVRIPSCRPCFGYFYQNSGIESISIKKLASVKVNFTFLSFFCESLKEFSFASIESSLVESINGICSQCTDLRRIDLHDLKLSKITSLVDAFGGCPIEEVNLKGCYFPDVTDLSGFITTSHISDFTLSGINFPKVEKLSGFIASSMIRTLKVINTTKVNDISRICTDCEHLEHVSIETSEEVYAESAFKNCPNLRSIEIKGAKILKFAYGNYDFALASTKLEKITCSQSVKDILQEPNKQERYLPPNMRTGGSGTWVII